MNPSKYPSKYQFYATALDSFQNYLDAERNWELFYGGSENPKYSVEEYEAMQRQIGRASCRERV